jgi:hypothetical protein
MGHMSDLLTPEDFMTLNRYEVYASLVANGAVMPFASGKTLPALARSSSQTKLRRLSQDSYGQSPAEIDNALLELGRTSPVHQAVGRRLRGGGNV